MAKQKTEAQIDRYSRFGAPWQWAAAFAVGTISASSTFINLVRTKFHEDNSFRQGFAVLHEAKNLQLQQMNDDQILASLDILKKYVGEHPSYQEFVDAREALNKYGKNALQLDKTYDIEEALQRYTKASEVFEKQCREGIDRAMLSKEYKSLAINSS